MSANFHLARMISDIRFQCFPHVPDEEKAALFSKLICVPINNEPVVKTVANAIQANSWVQLKRFLRALKKHKMLRRQDHRKDFETITGLYFGEQDEKFATELLSSLLAFVIESDDDATLWNSVMNLLFSATCHQDKVAALFLLATK